MVVLIALSMTALLLMIGVAVDSGRLFDMRISARVAADAAALAGAVTLYEGGTTTEAIASAVAEAASNGHTNGVGGVTVDVNLPPESGPRDGDSDYVEVVIEREVATLLLPAQLTTVRARGVAGIAPVDLGYAIVALDTGSTNGALNVGSQGSIDVNGGGIKVNSSSATAATNSGIVTSDGYTDVVGGTSGSWPSPRPSRPVTTDPFAGFPKPPTSGVTKHDGNPVPGATLQPGTYTGDIDGNNTWELAAGTYIMKGAGVDLSGNSSINGSGVFIFITQSSYPLSGGTCPSVAFDLTGTAASTLTPPTSGTYDGMLVYLDPECSGTLRIGGNGAVTTTGTIYAPEGRVALNGNNAAVTASQIVARTIDVQNADITLNYSTGDTAAPRIPALTE